MKDLTAFLIYIAIALVGVWIASKSFSYLLLIFFHKDAPWLVDVILRDHSV